MLQTPLFDDLDRGETVLDNDEEDESKISSPIPTYEDTLISTPIFPLTAITTNTTTTNSTYSFSLRNIIFSGMSIYLLILFFASSSTLYYTYNLPPSSSCIPSPPTYLSFNTLLTLLYLLIVLYFWHSLPRNDWSNLLVETSTIGKKWMIFVGFKQLIAIFDFIVFIYGNITYFDTKTDYCGNSLLKTMTLISLISSYIAIVLPLCIFGYIVHQYGGFIFRSSLEREETSARGRPAKEEEINNYCSLIVYSEFINNHPDNVSALPFSSLCSICYTDYEYGNELRLLPCHHNYHKGCIDKWFTLKDNCPQCKQRISVAYKNNKNKKSTNVSIGNNNNASIDINSTVSNNTQTGEVVPISCHSISIPIMQIQDCAPIGKEIVNSMNNINNTNPITLPRLNSKNAAVNAALIRIHQSKIKLIIGSDDAEKKIDIV